ncbi:MAG: hypothetical protein FRX49_05768 [Trebouxia sp. A1-2]|nr:MAG: hypothetical protein FRX49_05768 [Trebouxia sp. A1-2]
MTASTCALASSSRWFRHLFQAWKAPSLRVCLRNRMATVCSSLAVRYLHLHRLLCLRGLTRVRVTSSYLRVLTRKAGSLRWEGWVSCDTSGLGGKESLAICLSALGLCPWGVHARRQRTLRTPRDPHVRPTRPPVSSPRVAAKRLLGE